jgi:type II secretory pathway pseudopilin PulG
MRRSTTSYKGFTLIEMLIVMGILILLMALGIGGGRLALQNAADVATQGAVKQIYEAAQTYLSKNGAYPISAAATSVGTIATTTLKDYMESFDGGNDTSYLYSTDSAGQYILVCAYQGGTHGSGAARSLVCEGNAFGNATVTGSANLTKKKLDATTDAATITSFLGVATLSKANWQSKAWVAYN